MAYSFDKKKEKVVDVEVDEVSTQRGPTFKDKFKSAGQGVSKFGNKLNTARERFQEYQKERSANELKKLELEAKKTKLQAQVQKNKADLNKFKGKDKKKTDIFGF